MTDIKPNSIEEIAPKVPVHENNNTTLPIDISPTPSKSIHRSKTVRNLNSAGNKMRGLFKSKNKESSNMPTSNRRMTTTDDNGFISRPILSTSVSYSPGSENTTQHHGQTFSHQKELDMYSDQAIKEVEPNALPPQSTSSDEAEQRQAQQQQLQQQQAQTQQQTQVQPPQQQTQQQAQQQAQAQAQQQQQQQAQQQAQAQAQAQQQQAQARQQYQQQAQQQQHLSFQHELEQLNELIAQRTIEIEQEKKTKERYQMELAEAQKLFKDKEAEYSAIEHSFFEHTRAIRATDDDLSTIRDSFKLLKYSIARLLMTLNKKADRARATQKFVSTWPNLNIVDPTTGEMEPSFVNLLAEKLVHEHLVKHVFSVPIYPGLKVNAAYQALNDWLQSHSSQFSVRLRQQMAAVVAKSSKDSEIHQAAQKEKQNIATLIYDDLAEIYHPFLRENDAAVDEEKRYYNKICDIVDKCLKLTVAMRGQEVEITTIGIEEGKEKFQEETMTEVKGRTNGLVRFLICPTFMGGDLEHGFLEKGKVVITGN